ncbi:MAG: hypothetical protein R3F21_20720 [Myxococcota bacterium]
MRRPLDPERLQQVLEALGRACRGPGVLYLTGGATALLEGWRDSTVDVDLKLDPSRRVSSRRLHASRKSSK